MLSEKKAKEQCACRNLRVGTRRNQKKPAVNISGIAVYYLKTIGYAADIRSSHITEQSIT